MQTTQKNMIRVTIEPRFSEGKYGGWGLALTITPNQARLDRDDVKTYDGLHLAFNCMDLARENLAIINDGRKIVRLPVFVESRTPSKGKGE